MGCAAIATLHWRTRIPQAIEGPTCIVQDGAGVPQRWLDHGGQYLDPWEAVTVLYARREYVVHLLKSAPPAYCRHCDDVLHSTRVMAFTPALMWLTESAAHLLPLWQEEHERAPDYPEVAFTLALYRARLAMWVLPPWEDEDG